MNKETRNTLVYDFIGTAFCLVMAFALILMFSGCSDSESKQPVGSLGGAEEETAVYANLENLTISGMARIALASQGEEIPQIDMRGLEIGTVITLYELDSASFMETGVVLKDSIVNDSGDFTFQNVTLTSPYILITAERPFPETEYAYSVFADVRDTGKVQINVLTHLEALRSLHLVKTGIGFSQAKQQARTEILNAFGIYGLSDNIMNEDPMEYTALIYALSVALPTFDHKGINPERLIFGGEPLEMLFDAIAEHGSFHNIDASVDSGFVDNINANISLVQLTLATPYEYFEQTGEEGVRFYRTEQRVVEYFANMLSVVFGIGRCDQAREGETFNAPKPDYHQSCIADYGLVCRSGSWRITMVEKEHTEGTMTDARDGRLYKTVTINVGGAQQTWMAENLRFDAQEGSSCNEKWSIVEGCYYSNEALMDNVCPDGWRVPKSTDWETLLSSVRDYYAVPEGTVQFYLFDMADLGNPVGFGLKVQIGSYTTRLAIDPDEDIGETDVKNSVYLSLVEGYGFSESSERLPVRCIKN